MRSTEVATPAVAEDHLVEAVHDRADVVRQVRLVVTFAIAALGLIMVPGPDQALITRNALVGGRRGGLLTLLGGTLGLTVHAGGAALGYALAAVIFLLAQYIIVPRAEDDIA